MKILVLSDIHGEESVLEAFRGKAGAYGCVLIAGDSSNDSASFASELLEIFPEAYIILGNNEKAHVVDVVQKARNYAHGKCFPLGDGANLCAFGFSNPTPFNTPNEMEDSEIYKGLSKLDVGERTILMTHAPPKGVLDEIRGMHVGSAAIRRFIDERQPFLSVCGHLHEVVGAAKIGKTLVVNVPAGENGKYCEIETSGADVVVRFREM